MPIDFYITIVRRVMTFFKEKDIFTGAILETLHWWLTSKMPISQESIEKQIVDMMKTVYLTANTD